jgi:hypothetical protein
LALVGLSCACSFEAPVASPAPNVRRAPELVLPSHFDLAVRVDVARLRTELGAELSARALLEGLLDARTPRSALFADTLARADLLLFGLELGPGLGGPRTWAVRGSFASLDVRAYTDPRWRPLERAGTLAFESEVLTPEATATRLYRFGEDLLFFAPPSEGAAIERLFTAPAEPSALAPPERGFVSLAVRPSAFVSAYLKRYPGLGGYLVAARSASAFAEPAPEGLRLRLELGFDGPEPAEGAREVLAALLEKLAASPCAFGLVAAAADMQRLDGSLGIGADLDRTQAGALYGCVLHGTCCP